MTQALGALADRVAGSVIRPDDEGYDEARRVYNAMIDARPAAIVRCATDGRRRRGGAPRGREGDGPRRPRRWAQRARLRHGRRRDGRRPVRPAVGRGRRRTAHRARPAAAPPGAGSTTSPPRTVWPPPAASSPRPGIGGLTLGGGIGYLCRAHGLSCDNLVSAQVVTADGALVTASENENPDLFWALRGGGGNFGVVTEFTFRRAPGRPRSSAGRCSSSCPTAPAIFAYFDDFIRTAPREYGGFPACQIAPPLPFVPEDRVGEPFVGRRVLLDRVHHDGERIIHRFRARGEPGRRARRRRCPTRR